FGVQAAANTLVTVAGGGQSIWGGAPLSQYLDQPTGITSDPEGNLFFTETANPTLAFILKVSGTYFGKTMEGGRYYLLVGGVGSSAFGGDGGNMGYAYIN